MRATILAILLAAAPSSFAFGRERESPPPTRAQSADRDSTSARSDARAQSERSVADAPVKVGIAVRLDRAYDADVADAIWLAIQDAGSEVGQAVTWHQRVDAEAPSFHVVVTWRDRATGTIAVEYSADDGTGPRRAQATCTGCDARMLADTVREDAAGMLGQFQGRASTGSNASTTAITVASRGTSSGTDEPSSAAAATSGRPVPPPRPLGDAARRNRAGGRVRHVPSKLGWAGVGLVSGALLPGAVGLGLALRGARVVRRDPGNAELTEVRDPTHAGYALLGVAGGAVVTGAVLLIVDRVRGRDEARRSANTAPRGRAQGVR